MKTTFLLLSLLMSTTVAAGQHFTSNVHITMTYSQNGRFYVKSIPYDNEVPSLRGKTYVYEKGNAKPLYEIDRGFDTDLMGDNIIFLSNDGEVIFYVLPRDADEGKEGLQSVTIYRHGRLQKSFTEPEITGCDKRRERCTLLYSNDEEAIDKEKSEWGTSHYKKTFKAEVAEKERFLSDFMLFSFDDTIYLTDSKKRVHLFDLKAGELIRSESFDDLYEQLKDKGRHNQTEKLGFDAPTFMDFPNLRNGKNVYATLAERLDLKAASLLEPADEQYKLYTFKISGLISQDGSLEIEEIDVDEGLSRERIIAFFKTHKFDSGLVPVQFEKWHLDNEFFAFRKKDDGLARRERLQEEAKQRLEVEKNMKAESIDGVYIPRDVGECFAELDKLLADIEKQEMSNLSARDEMMRYHFTLGMWMRNNWRLWGGSRLQKTLHRQRHHRP